MADHDVIEGRRWSRQRWGWCIGLLLFLHILLIRLTPAPQPDPIRRASPLTPLRLVRNTTASESFQASLGDPTLFALPHLENVSGAAWLQRKEILYRVTNSVEAPQWLLASAAGSLKTPAAEPTTPALLKLAPVPYQPDSAAGPIQTRTQLTIEGPLNQWTQRQPGNPLPEIPPGSAPNRCVIQVRVNAKGLPVTQTLLESSGLPELDAQCSQFIRAARFLPPEGIALLGDTDETFSSTVTFRWLVIDR